MIKVRLMLNVHGFLKDEAAPMTTANMIPTPAPTDAPTAAADIELDFSFMPSPAAARSRASSKNI